MMTVNAPRTLRSLLSLAYNLFTQKAKQELADFRQWTRVTRPGEGDDFYRVNGAGEMLVSSAADYEDFLEPRPDMLPVMESELKSASARESLAVPPSRNLRRNYHARPERVRGSESRNYFYGLHWFFDHCETISDRNLERVKALGGGIAVQDRMAFQGEYH